MDSFPRSLGASRAADIKVHIFIDLSVHAGRSLLLMSVYKSSCRKSSIILTENQSTAFSKSSKLSDTTYKKT